MLKRAMPLLIFLWQGQVQADQFHYQNFLIGDRAIGLGGAYAGISDDASGVFYNPAGPAFALSNDISGSANAIYSKSTKFKKTIADRDFKEESGGTVPSFFGGLLKIDNIMKGLVFSWGIYSLDNELKNQNDQYRNLVLGNSIPCTDPNNNPTEIPTEHSKAVLKNFHRTVNSRGSTEFIGAGLSLRVHPKIAIGYSINYVTIDELIQEYQDVKQSSRVCGTDGTYIPSTRLLSQNIRQQLQAQGVQNTLAVQVALNPKISLGLTFKFGFYLDQEFVRDLERRTVKLQDTEQSQVESSGQEVPFINLGFAGISQAESQSKYATPLGSMPYQARLGMAYFASPRLLLSTDVEYFSANKNAQQEQTIYQGQRVNVDLYGKQAVLNFMAGMEYYITPSLPIRLGFFTNNDAREDIKPGDVFKRNHIDYLGGTMYLAWVQPNSQIGAGVVFQRGDGKSQKISDSPVIQDVESQAFTIAFSASTNL